MRRIRPATVLLLALILVLGYSLVIRQRREARLRAALARYKVQAKGDLYIVMGSNAALDWARWHLARRGDQADRG
jgi:hypothetical protein